MTSTSRRHAGEVHGQEPPRGYRSQRDHDHRALDREGPSPVHRTCRALDLDHGAIDVYRPSSTRRLAEIDDLASGVVISPAS